MTLEQLLISKAELIQFCGISKNLQKEDLTPFIRLAQQQDLLPFVGPEFYYDLVSSYDGPSVGTFTGATQSDLDKAWLGESGWTYSTGRTREFFGLRPALIWWSYARILENIDLRVTSSGARLANHEYSDRATREAVSTKAKEARATALIYATDCQTYFDKNRSSYTLWQYSPELKRGVINITKVE